MKHRTSIAGLAILAAGAAWLALSGPSVNAQQPTDQRASQDPPAGDAQLGAVASEQLTTAENVLLRIDGVPGSSSITGYAAFNPVTAAGMSTSRQLTLTPSFNLGDLSSTELVVRTESRVDGTSPALMQSLAEPNPVSVDVVFLTALGEVGRISLDAAHVRSVRFSDGLVGSEIRIVPIGEVDITVTPVDGGLLGNPFSYCFDALTGDPC